MREFVVDEQGSVSGDGNDHDRHGGFDLQPEIHPDAVDEAVREIRTCDADDADDHGEDAEGEDAAEDEFAA